MMSIAGAYTIWTGISSANHDYIFMRCPNFFFLNFFIESAITDGLLQPPFLFMADQIHTSLAPSPVPPNQAAIRSPEESSTIVEAWHWLKGGLFTINSCFTSFHWSWARAHRAPVNKSKREIAVGFIFMYLALGRFCVKVLSMKNIFELGLHPQNPLQEI